jgi:hypothetical protein
MRSRSAARTGREAQRVVPVLGLLDEAELRGERLRQQLARAPHVVRHAPGPA